MFLVLLRKYFFLVVCVSLFFQTPSDTAAAKRKRRSSYPKNVIFFIGDGMGYNQIVLTQELTGKKLHMLSLTHTGTVLTSSASQMITDSAAAASAMATGYKVNNQVLSIHPKGKKLTTILERFKKAKKWTGLITTTEIVDATPSSFFVHHPNRKEKAKIATAFVNSNVDLLFGGGRRFFLPKKLGGERKDKRNLVKEMKDKGYRYISSASDLPNIRKLRSKPHTKLLGLFTHRDFNYEINREEQPEMKDEPPLEYMTQKAIELLSKSPRGFFLMVEGGRIDHAAHQLDVPTMAQEVISFDKAVKAALKFAKKRRDTLVIVTADHETGGLTPTETTRHDYLRDFKVSSSYLMRAIQKKEYKESDIKSILKEHAHIKKLKRDELELIKDTKGEDDFYAATVLGSLLAKRAGILSVTLKMIKAGNTKGHTSLPVPIFASGPRSNLFNGVMENTDIALKISKATRVSLKSK